MSAEQPRSRLRVLVEKANRVGDLGQVSFPFGHSRAGLGARQTARCGFGCRDGLRHRVGRFGRG
jgi:hypothetical protein